MRLKYEFLRCGIFLAGMMVKVYLQIWNWINYLSLRMCCGKLQFA